MRAVEMLRLWCWIAVKGGVVVRGLVEVVLKLKWCTCRIRRPSGGERSRYRVCRIREGASLWRRRMRGWRWLIDVELTSIVVVLISELPWTRCCIETVFVRKSVAEGRLWSKVSRILHPIRRIKWLELGRHQCCIDVSTSRDEVGTCER